MTSRIMKVLHNTSTLTKIDTINTSSAKNEEVYSRAPFKYMEYTVLRKGLEAQKT